MSLITCSMSINEAIDLLRNYAGENKLTLHKGADEALLLMVENTWEITLPDDFKAFYRFTDGFETDKDIFNMIPLEEIIDNKNRHNEAHLYIAEYMIYSDMWQLDINPDDCNDYNITVESNYNTLILTHSLAEFITRFLKGGVFDPDGLSDWQEEVELQPVYTTKLKTAEVLLTVFYYGLRYGFISKKEVTDWADRLIMHEDEPGIFLIELSLSHDKNELISSLRSIRAPKNSVVARAVLGLLYHRLQDGIIDVVEVIVVIDKSAFFNLLTAWETAQIYDITGELWLDELLFYKEEITQKVLKFLVYYKEFEITNYKYWVGYNCRIEYNFWKKAKNQARYIL